MSEEPERAKLAKRRRSSRPVINEPAANAEVENSSPQDELPPVSADIPPAEAAQTQEKIEEKESPPVDKEFQEQLAKRDAETSEITEPVLQEKPAEEPKEEEAKKEAIATAGQTAVDFEKFNLEAPKTEFDELTYEEKRHRRSRNPLSRKVSKDLMEKIHEIDRTKEPEFQEPTIVTGIVSRNKTGGSSKELIRNKARSKDRSSKIRKNKNAAGIDTVQENPRVTKFFGRVRDVSGVLSVTPKVQTLESTIKPPSPFLKIALKMFREYFQARESKYSKLENTLRASKMPYSSVQYLSLAVFVSLLIAGISGFAIAYFAYLLGPFYILAIAGGAMAVVIFITIFLSLPGSTSKKRKKDIESKLPMALGYIATMASADMPVDQILFELGESPEYGAVSKEAKTISLATRVFGKDIVTALRDGAKYSPSPKLAEFLQGIVTTVTSGGNLKQYFKTKAVQYQGELSNLIRSNAESIGILAESYVTVGVAFPLMLIVILGVVASLQSSSSGMLVVLYLIDLMIIPLITIMFAFLISSTIKEIKI